MKYTKGMRVRCLKDCGPGEEFTAGKEYVIREDDEHDCRVVADDSGRRNGWAGRNFEIVRDFKVGDRVRPIGHEGSRWDADGVVCEDAGSSGIYLVEIGGVRVGFFASELRMVKSAKFKAGDRFRRTEAGGGREEFKVGYEGIVARVGEWPIPTVYCTKGFGHDPESLELVTDSAGPVRTVTRREIVPGVYGPVEVTNRGNKFVGVKVVGIKSPSELREAARIFNEIADVLEEGV